MKILFHKYNRASAFQAKNLLLHGSNDLFSNDFSIFMESSKTIEKKRYINTPFI